MGNNLVDIKVKEESRFKIYQELESIKNNYQNSYLSLYTQAKIGAIKKEYGINGISMHRGYYCPTPVEDVIICGDSRGRKLKNAPESVNPDYIYGFDIHNKLTYIDYNSGLAEVLLYEGESVKGILFGPEDDNKTHICQITECIYDKKERIVSYKMGTCYLDSNIDFATHEHYDYGEQGIADVQQREYIGKSTRGYRCIFSHDDKGYISGFDWYDYDWKTDDYVFYGAMKPVRKRKI